MTDKNSLDRLETYKNTGSLTVDNNLTVSGTMTQTGNATDSGNRAITGTLAVTGVSTLSGGATVTGLTNNSVASITAGTTQTQAGATAITADTSFVTVGNASDGIVLPAASSALIGKELKLVNLSNAAGKLYAAGSNTVNAAAGATGVTYTSGSTTGTITLAVCISATAWITK